MKVNKKKASGVMAHLMSNITPNSMAKTATRCCRRPRPLKTARSCTAARSSTSHQARQVNMRSGHVTFTQDAASNCDISG